VGLKRNQRQQSQRKSPKYDLARRAPREEQKKRIVVFCEGEVTEATYLEELGRLYRSHRIEVHPKPNGRNAPINLVLAAKAARAKSVENDDEFWAVFDRDQHHGIPEAFQIAKDSGVKIAFSNPCFEMWLLVHFQAQTAHIARNALPKMLRKFMHGYEKEPDTKLLFADGYALFEQAKKRAHSLWVQHERDRKLPIDQNPGSTAFRLVDAIRR
jgi:hypothetical protein